MSEEQLLEVKEAFNVFDSEQTGGLDAKELKAALTVLNIKLSKEEIRQIYSDLGKDIREKINYDDFLEIVTPRLPDRHTKDYIKGVTIMFKKDIPILRYWQEWEDFYSKFEENRSGNWRKLVWGGDKRNHGRGW